MPRGSLRSAEIAVVEIREVADIVDEGTARKKRRKGGWEAGELTRRDAVKLALAVGAAGGAVALGIPVGESLLSPAPNTPYPPDALIYTRFPEPVWWNEKANQPMRVTDFALWQGATGVWRGRFENGSLVLGSGLPVLVIRIPRDDSHFQSPPAIDFAIPGGFSLYHDDAARDLRFVVLYDRCVHLCCFPGWQVVTNPPPGRDYLLPCPTYQAYGIDPIYCVCHGSQYDPLVLTTNVNPNDNVTYVGAERVYGPAGRSVPVVAVAVTDDVLYGGMVDARWYQYCGD